MKTKVENMNLYALHLLHAADLMTFRSPPIVRALLTKSKLVI